MCLFCDIVADQCAAYKINNRHCSFVVLLDLYPIERGHCLVITKQHYRNYLECPNEILSEVNELIKQVVAQLQTKLGAKGFHITTNINKVGNQEILHLHWHIIPRYKINQIPSQKQKRLALTKKEFLTLQSVLCF